MFHIIRKFSTAARKINVKEYKETKPICSVFKGIVTSQMLKSTFISGKYNPIQQQQILTIINESTEETLSRFDLSKSRIKKLELWKKKQGNFNNLEEMLEVDGLGVKVLERFYKSVIETNGQGIERKSGDTKILGKIRGNLLTPLLDESVVNKMTSAVGIHLGITYISWAKINCEKNIVTAWSKHEFPNVQKKLHTVDLMDMVIEVVNLIPPGDIYVLEAMPNFTLNQKQPISVAIHQRNLQLVAALTILLNTSPVHNSNCDQIKKCNENERKQFYNVYFLREKIYSRLFRTLIGNEKVSSASMVSALLDSSGPAYCKPIEVEQQFRSYYDALDSVSKEILGQTLLFTIAFMELCVYRNPDSLRAISPGNKNL